MREKIFQVGVKAFITDGAERLLVLKATPDRPDGRWPVHWDIPGGRITKEGIKETLKRELIEEIGVRNAKILDLRNAVISNFKIDTKHGKVGLLLLVYNCKIPTGSKIKLSSEHSGYKWVNLLDATKLLAYKFPKGFITSNMGPFMRDIIERPLKTKMRITKKMINKIKEEQWMPSEIQSNLFKP